jgi:tetraacyldisaccharide 4'-kinase
VILVGNLSVGGTGKTPHVEYLVRLLQRNYKVATLSRGYGRRSSGFVVAGKGVSAEVIGDEPMQYFTKFENITVAVCEKRVAGIEKLKELVNPGAIIMDDGYQHRQVNPGMQILLTARDRLYTRDYVLPAGDLREPRSGSQRANCILVTRCDLGMTQAEKQQIVKSLNPASKQHVFFSSLVYDNPVHFFNTAELPVTQLAERNVLLFTGIAEPTSLEKYIAELSKAMVTVRFPDHHEFTRQDIVSLKEKFDKFTTGENILLTTEKDYNRLRGSEIVKELQGLPCYYIPVRIRIDREEEFNKIITTYVAENKGNR